MRRTIDHAMDPGRGSLRALRGGLLAACCALLGISAHVLGGGSVDLGQTLLLTVLLATAAMALAGRRPGTGTLLVVAAVAQAAFHVVLAAAHRSAELASHGAETHQSGPLDLGALDGLLPTTWMTLAHAAGAVLVAVVLARGDAALFALARVARRWICVPGRPSGVARGGVRHPVTRVDHPRPLARLLTAQLRYRGPPACAPA